MEYKHLIQCVDNFASVFFDFMLKVKCLLEYTNLFSPNDYEKNDEIVLKYFQQLKC